MGHEANRRSGNACSNGVSRLRNDIRDGMIKNRRAKVKWLILMVFLVAFSAGGLTRAETLTSPVSQPQMIVVEPGDTLWDIASEVASPETDIREIVGLIKYINGLSTSALRPGQTLYLPERGH